MKELSPTERSLANLAILLGIDPEKYGWKKHLSEWFGVHTGVLSNWIRRGIPEDRIESTVRKGFTRERWLLTSKSAPQSTISSTPLSYPVVKRVVCSGLPNHSSHGEIIEQFRNKNLAREINEILLAIEQHDPEILRRDVKGYLQGILTVLEAKKRGNDSFSGG